VLRCVYADLDSVLLGRGGSFLHAADGSFTLLGARALEACARAGAEVVPWSERAAADVAADAARLGLQAWIADGTLGLDDDTEPVADRAEGVARHLRARACDPADAIAVGDARELAPLVGALWLPAAVTERDPLLRLEERYRIAEADAGPALYEAVVTSLAEARGRSSSA
jgi:hypothetical protein